MNVRRSIRLHWPALAVVVSLMLWTCIGFAAWWYENRGKEQKFQDRIADLRAIGMPTDSDSLAAWYRGKTYPEGSRAWMDAFRVLDGWQVSTSVEELPYLAASWPTEIDPAREWPAEPIAARYLEAMRPLIRYIEEDLTKYPNPVAMSVLWDAWVTTLPFAHVPHSIIRLLSLEVEYALYHRDNERALRGIQAMRSVNDAFCSDMVLVTSLVTNACEDYENLMIRRSLAIDVWTDEQLSALIEQVRTKKALDLRWREMLHGERGFSLEILTSPVNEARFLLDEAWGFENRLWFGLASLRVNPDEKLGFLDLHEQMETAARDGIERLFERGKRFEEEFDRVEYRGQYSFVSRLGTLDRLKPAYAQAAKNWEQLENNRRFTLTALGVKRYRLKHGRWPRRIAELKEVGITEQVWKTTFGDNFGFEVDGESALVWTYQPAPLPHQRGAMAKDYASTKLETAGLYVSFVVRIR